MSKAPSASGGFQKTGLLPLSLFSPENRVFVKGMYSAHDISTMKVVYKSVEMAEGLQMEIEELAKTVCSGATN